MDLLDNNNADTEKGAYLDSSSCYNTAVSLLSSTNAGKW